MKTGRVRATMEEECREILRCVEEAIAQETRGVPDIPPDGARMAAYLHLQRAAQRPLRMDREGATCNPPLRRPPLSAWPQRDSIGSVSGPGPSRMTFEFLPALIPR